MSRYDALSRDELARLVPELLLIGQLIDRSGMAWCIQAFGREQMAQVAIEEWAGASPIYTRRMQRALNYVGDDVITIFKGLQLDIGAPPQFMDFRYAVEDRWNGEFWLDHCGALMDVEPMGEAYVKSMCHDIEDPTFDATAVATNPRAQVRPIHRPPRSPADRHPHCRWTVRIDEAHPPAQALPAFHVISKSKAAAVELAAIDPTDEGRADYAGPLLSDVDFATFSRSALVRIADEVCLQMHLLYLSFSHAVRQRAEPDAAEEICEKQLVGIAGIAAERIARCLNLGTAEVDVVRLMAWHPLLNPAAYVTASVVDHSVQVAGSSPAQDDRAWIALCGPGRERALQAIARAVDPSYDVTVTASTAGWSATVVRGETPAKEFDEVAVTRFSSGSNFAFESRRSLPITPV
ncbi:hypothetical protein [Nocardioides limicola]|uniref:hypothetical protein n=1 Tax=Nocardioides limicola TaxID=2803368 RepID=UPI00193B2705|nr:hypothetical protein [Nocardioides sp. DJM-14]